VESSGNGKDNSLSYAQMALQLLIQSQIYNERISGGKKMTTAIEYERIRTNIGDFNLTATEESTSWGHGNDSPGGFLAELYLGPRVTNKIDQISSKWHIHYRE
jgi:hypothetical protein